MIDLIFYSQRSWPSLVKVRASQARDRGFKSRTSHSKVLPSSFNDTKLPFLWNFQVNCYGETREKVFRNQVGSIEVYKSSTSASIYFQYVKTYIHILMHRSY